MDRREFSKRSLLLTAGILTGSHKIGMANEAGDTNNYYEEPAKKLPIRNFDVVVAGPISRLSLLSTFPKIFTGTHLQHPAVRVYQARKAVIRTKPPKTLLPDGELCGSTPTEITIHPRRIRYFA